MAGKLGLNRESGAPLIVAITSVMWAATRLEAVLGGGASGGRLWAGRWGCRLGVDLRHGVRASRALSPPAAGAALADDSRSSSCCSELAAFGAQRLALGFLGLLVRRRAVVLVGTGAGALRRVWAVVRLQGLCEAAGDGRLIRVGMHRDVVIAGAGVVGTAIARELTRCGLEVTLLEAGSDIGAGTSKANTALLHTGFDAKPGTLEARLVPRGFELLSAYATRVGIPLERTGALLVAWDDEQVGEFEGIVERSRANGYEAIAELGAAELYRREPNLGPGARGALEVPDESLICPFTTPLAFATEAVRGGCELRRSTPVTAVERLETTVALPFRHGPLTATRSSTPPGCAVTSSTACWAAAASPSRRDAAS